MISYSLFYLLFMPILLSVQKMGVLIIMCILTAAPAMAATATTPYQPKTTLEYISYLQGVVDTLHTQISTQTTDNKTVSARVKTLPAELAYEVELRATFSIGNLSSVYAWFEYGESSLTKATPKTRISKSAADKEYVRTITNLKAGTVYKYRAVYESSSGTKYYGAIQTFSTKAGVDGVTTDDYSSGSTVSTSKGSLTVDKTSYKYGDTIKLSWTVPSAKADSSNWVGLFESSDDNRTYVTWKYLGNSTKDTLPFTASKVGTLEFRLFYDNGYDDVVTSRKITVSK